MGAQGTRSITSLERRIQSDMPETTSFQWDGTEEVKAIVAYSTSLGARDTTSASSHDTVHVLPLSRSEAQALVHLHADQCGSVLLPEVSETHLDAARDLIGELTGRIESFLAGLDPAVKGWFVKTNRHSCKDSPIDHPTQADVELFRQELRTRGIATACATDVSPDEIDFGPAFEAFCASRLRAIAVGDGPEVLSLLTRSYRAYQDLTLQL